MPSRFVASCFCLASSNASFARRSAFCSSTFGVTFPMFAKVKTRAGDGQSNVYAALQDATGELPNWNFCKYLVGKDGEVLGFYRSGVAPQSDELLADIEQALGA